MLLFKSNQNKQNQQITSPETYQQHFHWHQKNACVAVKDASLIAEAVQLAQHQALNAWVWQAAQAESHPALLVLCAFWEYFQIKPCQNEVRIPYIQLFLGDENYLPLIPGGAFMPLKGQNPVLQQQIRAASVLFGHEYLVTYLAGRHISANHSTANTLIYYTVHHQPVFQEIIGADKNNFQAFDQQNQLAWRTLQALRTFPNRFPLLWQALKKPTKNTATINHR